MKQTIYNVYNDVLLVVQPLFFASQPGCHGRKDLAPRLEVA